jgi:hypothetical protein
VRPSDRGGEGGALVSRGEFMHRVEMVILRPAPGVDIPAVRWHIPEQSGVIAHSLDFTPAEARAAADDIETPGAEPRVASLSDAERRRMAEWLRDVAGAVELVELASEGA